ncbi:MAG: pyridoxine 5'-phosphate synthase [Coxiellaceae bacterium]|nr:pyridoxine 5'-phosphate synthase [Coxiellaceae bacterium]
MGSSIRLGVNIDHVATLRQARGVDYPDPVKAALLAIQSGADGITLHLREDRRHIQEQDLALLMELSTVPVNLEMAVTEEMLAIAEKYKPAHVCIVPEKREELTTEGGLDVVAHEALIQSACERLAALNIQVSLFIDPVLAQIDAAIRCGAPAIEIHTGHYANLDADEAVQAELDRIQEAATYAAKQGVVVNAGHGLHYGNVVAIAAILEMNELNIGHSLIAQSVFDGLGYVVSKMKRLMLDAR